MTGSKKTPTKVASSQGALMGWVTKKEKVPVKAKTTAPKYPLRFTRVKKKVNGHDSDKENEDDMSTSPTYLQGKLTGYNASDDSYEVTFETDIKESWTAPQVQWGSTLYKTLGASIMKPFGEEVYKGEVVDAVKFDGEENAHFRVLFDDGDVEDFDREELNQWMERYKAEHTKSKGRGHDSSKKSESKPRKKVKKDESFPNTKQVFNKSKGEQEDETLKVEDIDDDASMVEIESGEDDSKRADDFPPSKTASVPESRSSSSRRSRKASSKITSYFEIDFDDFDTEGNKDEDIGVTKGKAAKRKSSSRSSKSKTATKKKRLITHSDSEFESYSEEEDDDDDLDSDIVMEVEDEEDSVTLGDESSVEDVKRKKSRSSKAQGSKKSGTAATKKTNAPKSSSKKVKFDDLQEELQHRMKNAGYRPNNNPQTLPANGPYVDPVGVDPTQGIVESIIGAQVRKVGELLLKVSNLPEAEKEKGELSFPLSLQTACSGTDAPSIALGLIKESLDKIYTSRNDDETGDDDGGKQESHGFGYSHEMSCEIEPFKQAYIGRNFPGVLLFPDITKLTEKETVVDVYGRPQKIPDGNLFVAGTSCKDFSMLKTSYRKDIEDKGTSGETFLAAVEFLEIKQPPVAIFENVDGAPWAKMQEYITGRLDLSERNNTKSIKDAKKKADADNELKFLIDEEGQYVAEEIPRQVGIKAGSIVQGFVKSNDNKNNVQPLKSNKKSGKVSLKQIAKEHNINLNEDTLVMHKEARYCTHLCKVDTKEYGLPQTRNRKYLFIWRSDDPDDDLGEYFQKILDHLKTPLLYSMDAFLLPPTHDRIRCFREALRSGPGLMVARERAKELDFWDWELAHVKDLPLHLAFRKENGLEERSRWLTGWDGTKGHKTVAPGLWPELVSMWNHRRCDLIDCFAGAAFRDAVSRDPLHHSFTWDLSQNVTRAPFRSATVGVSGCVTPGGELLMPHKGRTVMGYEKLLLQGIPFSRLLLGPETEVQLSDLAGNAMSVPVICATMLAAICAPQLRREELKRENVSLQHFALDQKYDSAKGAVLAERGDLHNVDRDNDTADFLQVFSNVAKDLADDAYLSSVLCTCESSGRISNEPKFFECKDCGMSICHECYDRHQTESHSLKEIIFTRARPDPHVFERKLRCVVPSMLCLGKDWENAIKDCGGLEAYSFQLQQVDRKKGHWSLTYGAWEDHGSSRQVAEMNIVIGRVGTLDSIGLAGYIKCFAPAIRHKDPLRGRLQESARLIMKLNSDDPAWEIRAPRTSSTLQIVGTDPCPSQRVQVGLSSVAFEAIQEHKPMKRFIPKIQSRNNLTKYHRKWKTWPGTIDISGDDSGRINGTYRRLSCKQTVVLSALWRRDASSDLPAMYIYIRPDVVRSDLDVAVVSPTPSYQDNMEICELRDWIPENALVEKTHATKVTFLDWEYAPDHLKWEIPKPMMTMNDCGPFHERVCGNPTDASSGSILCEVKGLSKPVIKSLLQHTQNCSRTTIQEIDLVGRSGTQNAKRLSILAAPSLLKYAAEDKLPLRLSKWYTLPSASGFGTCEKHVPTRPKEKWEQVKNKGFVRVYDAEESNAYYHKLQRRPTPFQVYIDKESGSLDIRMNPSVAAHHAAASLVKGRALGDDYAKTLEVKYCLSELSSMGEPDTREFHVPNSDAYDVACVEGLELPLYKRQAKALTRMQAIERGDVHFSEEERSEHLLHGIGWCLIARAAKKSPLRGGVLGDAIGSGKTVVTIALILGGIQKARANSSVQDRRSGATLIVVPPGLVKQWDDERKKFTKNKLKCITIDCTQTLKRFSVKEICNADIVIVPAGIIEERGKSTNTRPYTEHLTKKAKSNKIPPAPSGYSQREAPTIEGTWVRNMASGPEIYVGNNGKQKTRDEQAYYGHCYSEAVKKLRQKTFDGSERGVPIEYFTWERIVIDECHETLVTGRRQETDAADFKAQARRGAREFLGVAQTTPAARPLVANSGVWGLTGTPLLETEARVTELANLMGGTYLTGSAHHWRKEERESGRDLFLNQQAGTRSREYRCAVQEACHAYVREACQRNRGAKLQVNLNRKQHSVNMTSSDGEEFLREIATFESKSFSVSPDKLGEKASNALSITASSNVRHAALFDIIDSIQGKEPETKIIVFANTFFGGYKSALAALTKSGRKFCNISESNSVHEQNEIISWFRHVDATDEEKSRPRILLLSFEQAAGHNLQEACHHVIMYDPMYSGTDAVADASVEEQAVGRVMRQGQKYDVTVTRIIVKGPNGESCVDDWIVKRNLDEDVLRAATSNFD